MSFLDKRYVDQAVYCAVREDEVRQALKVGYIPGSRRKEAELIAIRRSEVIELLQNLQGLAERAEALRLELDHLATCIEATGFVSYTCRECGKNHCINFGDCPHCAASMQAELAMANLNSELLVKLAKG